MKGILEVLERKDILIAADVNAKSILWGSKATDAKGELVEEFSFPVILNRPGNLPTHRNFNGYKTNINVTLASRELSESVVSWEVKDWSISDHRPIELTLNLDSVAKRPLQRKRRFNTRLADWKKFSEQIEIK